MKKRFRSINLQLFGDGGGEGAGENTTLPSAQGENTGDNGAENGAEKGTAAESTNSQGAQEETFENLIKGKYKKEYDDSIQKIVGRRLSALRQENKTQGEILSTLMARFNVGSIEELGKVINSDEQVRAAAESQGMNEEVYRNVEQIRVREMQRSQAEEMDRRAKMVAAQEERWQNEIREAKELYPEFDIDEVIKNPDFRALITTKNPQYAISVKDAYRMVYFDDIQKNIEAAAADKVSKSIQSRGERPSENGIGGNGAAEIKRVASFTKQDRAEIARRAARGEKISF